MSRIEEVLRPVKNIRGGASLPHRKNTAEIPSAIMPPPAQVVIPMQQHIGAPCTPCVKKGDTVYVGTKIGDSDKYISAPIHSSVSGTVSGFGSLLMPSGQTIET
ncbi:MAG: electron transport complex subunit RsxC, partial [Clostridia bacterium]|nr:electron transport complex subunit RsxC [Clostridia bacterium]